VKQHDVLLDSTYITTIHLYRDGLPMRAWMNKHHVREMQIEYTAELLAYEPWVNFPQELGDAIIDKILREIPKGRVKVHLTDPEGTDLTFETDYTEFIEQNEGRPRTMWEPGVIHFTGRPELFQNAEGWIAVSHGHVGPFPTMRLHVNGGRIVKVEGGGEVGEYVQSRFREDQNISFGAHPGPGSNWLEEMTFQTGPKYVAFDNPNATFSNYFWRYRGSRRSGVIHMALGSGSALVDGPKVLKKKLHTDMELYFPTLVIGGKTIIDKGHLTLLDDREIRKIAAKYGDPDELLREDWIPAIPGVNVR
jgi:hypothetical protein